MSTSATGGYLVQTETPLPGDLTFEQYIQQVFVGMLGVDGTQVRPKWQKNAAKFDPTPEDNTLMFGVTEVLPDANSFQKFDSEGNTVMQRHEEISILCSFYGELSKQRAIQLRDAFEISQNRDALREANMGLKSISPTTNVSELKGQVWFKRVDMTIVLKRQVDKTFSVLALVGVQGTIEGQKSNDQIENVPWNVSEP
jgi:hypothetical protein